MHRVVAGHHSVSQPAAPAAAGHCRQQQNLTGIDFVPAAATTTVGVEHAKLTLTLVNMTGNENRTVKEMKPRAI